MDVKLIPIVKLSLPSNTISFTGTNKPLKCQPQLIGKGSFGKVYSVSEDEVYKQFKIITFSQNDFAIIENNIKEFSFYKMLMAKDNNTFTSSVFIPSIPSCIVTPLNIRFKNPFMYIEMSNYGTPLSKINLNSVNTDEDDINENNNDSILFNETEITPKEKIKFIFKQLVEGVEILNRSNMSHGDLKPNNIIVDENNNVTIIDYGSICFFHSKYLKNKYQRCTIFYVSPEELITGNYSLYNDWWSLGIILFEFYTKKCFIRYLLQYLNVKDDIIEIFMDYSCALKSTSSFDPRLFLINIYSNLKQQDINTFININIEDQDIQHILKLLLKVDPLERSKSKKEVLVLFEYKDIVPTQVKVLKNLQKFTSYNFKYLSYDLRKYIVENIFKICFYYKEFGKEVIGHSIMLFDRFYFRLNPEIKVNIYVYSLLCIIISSMILKGESFKGNNIIKYVLECYSISCNLKQLEESILFLIETLDYSLLCLPPDIIYNYEVEYSKLLKLYITYPVINDYVYSIFKLLA
jgi:serine/threonine protein kinase